MIHQSFLTDIAIVLGVAAVTSFVAKSLKLPSVLGFLFAGFIIGPYIPIPFFADIQRVESLSEFGVILVMFAVGLEFRFKTLFKVLPHSGFTAFIEMSTMFLVGVLTASLLGWTKTQGIFLGSAIAISSTMLVSKVFEEHPPSSEVRQQVFGVLVVQDIVAIVILALLGTLAAGVNSEGVALVPMLTKLVGFLVGITVLGLLIIPKFVRQVFKLKSQESLVVVSMGICFSMALLIEHLGYSVALGAFLAGMLVAESGLGKKIEHTVSPLKDMFAAVFFVSVGMQVNPQMAVTYFPVILLLSVLIIFFQFFSVSLSGVLSGMGLRNSVNSSLALGQIGEFAFIIAAIGKNAKLVDSSFQTILVSVSILTSFTTPLIWKSRVQFLNTLDKLIPKKIDILIQLYEAWFNKLKKESSKNLNLPRRILYAIVIDVILLISLPPLLFATLPTAMDFLEVFNLGPEMTQLILAISYIIIFIPILYSLISNVSQLLTIFVNQVFKSRNQKISPNLQNSINLFKLSFQILILYVIWIPLMISARTFLSSNLIYYVVLSFGLLTTLWLVRKPTSKKTEVISGGERILDVLSRQSFPEHNEVYDQIGLKDLTSIKVQNPDFYGKTLAEVNLRAQTGCNIVCIITGSQTNLFPSPNDVLNEADILKISGDSDSILKARKLMWKK